MTDSSSIGRVEMEPQAPSDPSDSNRTLSRQSDDIDYEVAHQLIQHAQGRHDFTDGGNAASTSDGGAPESAAAEQINDQRAVNGKLAYNGDPRRSTSQDRMSESQYAPLKNPPAMGQVCT